MSWVHIIVHDFSTLLAFSDTRSVSGIYWAGSGRANVIVRWFIQTINYIYNLMKVIYPLIFYFFFKVIKNFVSVHYHEEEEEERVWESLNSKSLSKYNNLDYCYVNCPAAASTAVHIKFAETSSVSYLEGIYLTPLEPTWSLNFKMVACHVIDYLWFFYFIFACCVWEKPSHPKASNFDFVCVCARARP